MITLLNVFIICSFLIRVNFYWLNFQYHQNIQYCTERKDTNLFGTSPSRKITQDIFSPLYLLLQATTSTSYWRRSSRSLEISPSAFSCVGWSERARNSTGFVLIIKNKERNFANSGQAKKIFQPLLADCGNLFRGYCNSSRVKIVTRT